jgi:murein hydrolase activator
MRGWIAFGAALAAATMLAAQAAPDPRVRLARAAAELADARQRSARLEAQSRGARDEAERARLAQAAVAARLQSAEALILAAEARFALAQGLLRLQERRLAERQQPAVQLVAALQTMARRPVAAALVQPGSLTDLVHVRALLATVGPRIAAQTAGLRGELERTRRLRGEAARALTAVREGRDQARVEQLRLARLEADQRRRSTALAGAARLEQTRAESIAAGTRDLDALVRALAREGILRDRLASLPGPSPRPSRLSDTLPVQASGAEPSQPDFRFPVLGPIARGFGESLPSGARSRGVAIAARVGALVVAPAAGRITYAGLFRGYGAIAIIDHGDGYTSLITGLATNHARVGDTVAQGSPLGRAGPGGIGIELRRAGQPVDFTTLVG